MADFGSIQTEFSENSIDTSYPKTFNKNTLKKKN